MIERPLDWALPSEPSLDRKVSHWRYAVCVRERETTTVMNRSCSKNRDPETSGLELVIQRATLDPDFRRRLIADPKAAIAIDFGMQLPADFRLKFIERDPGVDVMVVLPDLVDEGPHVIDRDVKDAGGGAGPVWLADLFRALQRTPWG